MSNEERPGGLTAALPFLPGNTFTDKTVSPQVGRKLDNLNEIFLVQKTKFHRSQTLGYKNGYSLPSRPTVGIGGEKIPYNQLSEADLDELSNMHPSLTYGNSTTRSVPMVEFVPAHVSFDKKVRKHD